MTPPRSRLGRLRQHGWALAFGGAALLIGVLHLAALGTSPPGLYSDEASIGYNAWAIAHHGVDEHGVRFPLFFEAFGEFKNPLYVYALAPLTRVLPLTPYVERLPAALFGLGVCGFAALMAWRLLGMRSVALLVFITAGITPWLVQESRVGFEVISMVACLMAALWCLARAEADDSSRWYAAAGAAIGLSVFAYTTGRAFGLLITAALSLAYGVERERSARWMWSFPPIAVAYGVLFAYIRANPGLGVRFSAISINYNHASFGTLVARFLGNWLSYWDVHFLFTHGDGNLRHSTGWGGMLLVSTMPAIVVGAAVCLRRFPCEPFPRLLVLGAILAPVPAALTAEGTPHSLRAVLMVPFLLGFAAYGWRPLVGIMSLRPASVWALAALVCVESGGYFFDTFVDYPGRAAAAFDAREGPAIERAAALAGKGHDIYLSRSLDTPYIQALFYLRPDPNAYATRGLPLLHMHVKDAEDIDVDAQPGDVVVMAPGDGLPPGAHVLFVESWTSSTGPPDVVQPPTVTQPLVVVARR